MICPSCKGMTSHESPCRTCKGYGAISAQHEWRIKYGAYIQRHRERAGMSKGAFARRYGISRMFLMRIEAGDAPKIVYVVFGQRLGIAVEPFRERKLEHG